MWRKPANIKSEQKLSDKDVKKLQADATRLLAVSPEQAATLLPRKPGLSVQKCGGGCSARIYVSEGCAVAFDPVGSSNALVPSLPSLWRLPPTTLPTLLVPAQAAPFVLGGSDLMLPGVMGWRLPPSGGPDAVLAPGMIVCVAVFGNPAPFAIGTLLLSRRELEAQLAAPGSVKGRCLEVLHCFGDWLWLSSGALLPNEGFEVREDAKIVGPVLGRESAGAGVGAGAGADEAGGTGAGAGAGADEAAGGGESEGRGEESSGEEGEEEEDGWLQVSKEEAREEAAEGSECRGEPHRADGVAVAQQPEARRGTHAAEGEAGAQAAVEAQDRLLRACFLQAAHSLKERDLPMALNTFYVSHLRPSRPAGSSVDVKLSSHRKLLPFLRAMEAEGLCALSAPPKGGKGAHGAHEPVLKAIERTAAAYVEHACWSQTAAAAEAAAAHSGVGVLPLSVSTVYRPCEAQRALFPPCRKALYTEAAALAILHEHIDRTALLASGGGAETAGQAARGSAGCRGDARLRPDPLLSDALFAGEALPAEQRPLALQLAEARRAWVRRLQPWTRLAGGGLAKPVLHAGTAVRLVRVHTEQRRGHMCTVLSGLEAVGLDERRLAPELQVLLGTSATVEQTPCAHGPARLEVMVQGLWDRAVIAHLHERHGVPERLVENRAADGKASMRQRKMKAATNVRRT